MLNIAGAEQRQDDLFANENFFSRGKSALKGLKGVENVYTQHSPHLVQTIDNLIRGRLRDTSYPFVNAHSANANAPNATGATSYNEFGATQQRHQDVILFIIGGTTYEEARTIALLNAQHQHGSTSGANSVGSGGTAATIGGAQGTGMRFLLGGTTIHNSHSYLNMIQDAASRFGARIAKPPPNLSAGPASSAPVLNLSIGPVQLAVGGGGGSSAGSNNAGGSLLDPEYLGEAASGARDLATDLFGRVRRGVEGTINGLQ